MGKYYLIPFGRNRSAAQDLANKYGWGEVITDSTDRYCAVVDESGKKAAEDDHYKTKPAGSLETKVRGRVPGPRKLTYIGDELVAVEETEDGFKVVPQDEAAEKDERGVLSKVRSAIGYTPELVYKPIEAALRATDAAFDGLDRFVARTWSREGRGLSKVLRAATIVLVGAPWMMVVGTLGIVPVVLGWLLLPSERWDEYKDSI